MRYVKIKAKNYNESMMKLKMEYGDDAIPISHKYIKEGGLFNSKLLAKELVELTAAIPERKPPVKAKPEVKSTIDFTVGDTEPVRTPAPAKSVQPPQERFDLDKIMKLAGMETPAERAADKAVATAPAEAPRSEIGDEMISVSRTELSSMKKLEKEFHELKDALNKMIETRGRDSERRNTSLAEEDALVKPYMDILLNNEFGREECNSLIEEVKNSVSRDDLRDKFKIEKTLKDLLKSRIITCGPIKKGHKKKVLMFIGPTGVGKTTTMAKLGALFALRENHSVAFVTIDNYRIAATEQLKKYAEIMKIPIYVVSDQKQFKEVIDKEKAEIIMVDTSGRSHRNELKISEMKSYAEAIDYDCEKILCISANTKKGDLDSVFKSFDKVNFGSVIVTKVDETSHIGNVIEIADKYKKPISYFTNGQEVPNDIDIADPDKIVNMIIGTVNQ